jgi:hypothetical protein
MTKRRRIGEAYAVIRFDHPTVSDNAVTVKEIVSTLDEAVAEVERLNALRKDDSYRYVWQATRWVQPPLSPVEESSHEARSQ